VTRGDRILEAARDLFLRQGFHATSLEPIAAEAGFTKGAVFSNFESKADLFPALIDERTSERIGAMDNALAPPEPDDLRGCSGGTRIHVDRPPAA